MSKRFLLTVLILILGAAPAAATMGIGYQPIANEAYTDDLEQLAYSNGDMPATRMIDLGDCLLERDAGYTLSLLLEAARFDGVDLVPHECYRSYTAQADAYDRRCPIEEEDVVRVNPDTGEEVVVGTTRSRVCSGPPIARPGWSNHGWGRAVDFGNGARVLSCGDAAFQWLRENGAQFGWVHPDWAICGRATQEAWHWEWGGVTEALPLPTPTPTPGATANARLS